MRHSKKDGWRTRDGEGNWSPFRRSITSNSNKDVVESEAFVDLLAFIGFVEIIAFVGFTGSTASAGHRVVEPRTSLGVVES